MLNRLSALAVCAAFLLLTGCGSPAASGSRDVPPESVSASSASQSIPAGSVSSAASRSVSESVSSSSAPASSDVPVQTDSFDAMMDAIAGYEYGTAGSSLKLYAAACEVLNYSAECKGDTTELRSRLADYLAGVGTGQKKLLASHFSDIDSAAQAILSQGIDAFSGLLADAGSPNRFESYDPDAYGAVADELRTALEAS